MGKNKEILSLRNYQAGLKKEIENLKIKIPQYSVGYVFLVALFIYFFDEKLYHYFGGSINFIKASIAFFLFIGVIILYKFHLKIKKKESEINRTQAKLYKYMRLENKNE